jgi:type IV secretory pathway VirB2 component (pilin)
MARWLILAVGAVLLYSGATARTYDFPNQSVPQWCWQFDWIGLYSCFNGPAGPQIIVWGTLVLGIMLVFGSLLYPRRKV